MAQTDHDIEMHQWSALRAGERSALAWIYDRYFKVLYNYGRKMNASTRAVEDAIHDLFVDLWRMRENLATTSSIRFYLYRSLRRRLVRNDAVNGLFVVRETGHDDLADLVPSKEEDLIAQETHHLRVHQLKRFLNDLSPRQYEAMVLRFYDELSFEEIGDILHVNEQSARNLVQRGLAQLKQYSRLLLTFIALLSVAGFWRLPVF